MKQIINFSMNNKFAVWLMTIIITLAGLYAGLNMKLETLPDIDPPVITVTTTYPGATPEEVADEISEPLEQQISNLSGVNTVSSTSYQNASNLQIEYSFDKSLDEAEDELSEAVEGVDLPDGVESPEVSQLDFNAFPVLSLSAVSEDQSLDELTAALEENVIPSLESLEGVADVQVSGQELQEISIDFDEEALSEYGLDEDTVVQMIQGSDVSMPLGLYNFEDAEKSVVVNGELENLDELRNLEIPAVPSQGAGQQAPSEEGEMAEESGQIPQGEASSQMPGTGENEQTANIPTVALKELANIEMSGKTESISRTNGEDSVSLQIVKSQEANTVDVVNLVKEQVNDFEENLNGVSFINSFDQGEPIEESVSTMLNKALFGGLFAVAVILLFLRNVKTTLISVISIPLSLLMAVLVLNQMGITLNIMTLGAMTVAIGRVVDDSIVVVENIYRRMSLPGEELKGKALIRSATREMFMPIFSSTIVTIAVFLPLGLVEGMVGQIFLPFALTVVFALAASLLVAVTIVPMMSHSLLKPEKIKAHTEGSGGRLGLWYKSLLNKTLNHKIIASVAAVAILAGSIALVPLVGVSFLPSEDQKVVMATYNPEPGQTIEDVEEIAIEAQEYFEGREGADTIQYSVGGENPMSPGASNQAAFNVEYNDDAENFDTESEQVIEDLQSLTDTGEWASQDFSSTGSSSEVELLIYGENIDEIKPVVKDVEGMLTERDDLSSIDSSVSESYEEYQLVIDHDRLSESGLTAGQVGMELNESPARSVVTTVTENGEELDVYVASDNEEYQAIEDLTAKELQTASGETITIDEVVDIEEGTTADTVTRRDGQVYASVSASITSDEIGSVTADIQEEIDSMELPTGMDITLGGVSEDIEESFTQLGLAMLAAIAIVYLVLVIFFGGGLAPLAILFSLPFTVIGAVLGLLVTGETLSISAMIGGLMLIGIVVTNAIVLIDRVIHKENDGFTTREALLDAGVTRLRPILMTALATIGALMPLALGFEGGSIISKGLGVTVIGGLASSTLLTLLIVPLVYEMLSKFKKKKTTIQQ
ncbi:efflux RND transporter permease subunit [Halobacillus sp. B23F22_1]|uniref:efflux RND transporter permease subunit n=1 Tax=Halobacillus sp. B23F22_1 TaxID=3459514 RepID=UPI00373EBB79